MTKDLHEDGDGAWLATYPDPHEALPIGGGLLDRGARRQSSWIAERTNDVGPQGIPGWAVESWMMFRCVPSSSTC